VVYIKETSRATDSRWGGVQVYNVDEADTAAASKPQTEKWELQLGKKMGIAYMTEELLEDAPAMQDVYGKAFAAELAFKCDDEVFRGGGASAFTGVMGHASAISVAKETGQLADTIDAKNIQKMWARVHPRSKSRGVWFVNTETFPELQSMQIGLGTGGTLVYMPPGGISGAPYGTIYGRPVIEIEYASKLGDLGDIAFLDLDKYKVITKGATGQSESMHVRFLYDEMTFKWTLRINGAPKLKSPLTPYQATSGNTLSPFVFLAARA
jgi:HK97 family phage major capsid protein